MSDSHKNIFPKPPPGYLTGVQFRYPKIKLQIAALVVLFITTPPLLLLVYFLHRGSEGRTIILIDNLANFLTVLAAVVITVIVHELIHGTIYRWLGYRVTYGFSLHQLAAYAAAFKQWQTREHNITAALAPLIILSLVQFPLLAFSNPVVIRIALAGLLMNIGGSVGDLYLVWRLMRLPRRTLLYDINVRTMLVYVPSGED